MCENLKKIKKTLDKTKTDVYNEHQKEAVEVAEKVFATAALKEVMQKQGVTNADMSRRLHVTPQTMYERLAKNVVKSDNLCEMAVALGMKIVMVASDKRVMPGEYELK